MTVSTNRFWKKNLGVVDVEHMYVGMNARMSVLCPTPWTFTDESL